MNQSAANKLLKLIEEPPEKTLILMVSENTDKILAHHPEPDPVAACTPAFRMR